MPGAAACTWPDCKWATKLKPVKCSKKECNRLVHHLCGIDYVGDAQEQIDNCVNGESTKWCYYHFKKVRCKTSSLSCC